SLEVLVLRKGGTTGRPTTRAGERASNQLRRRYPGGAVMPPPDCCQSRGSQQQSCRFRHRRRLVAMLAALILRFLSRFAEMRNPRAEIHIGKIEASCKQLRTAGWDRIRSGQVGTNYRKVKRQRRAERG